MLVGVDSNGRLQLLVLAYFICWCLSGFLLILLLLLLYVGGLCWRWWALLVVVGVHINAISVSALIHCSNTVLLQKIQERGLVVLKRKRKRKR